MHIDEECEHKLVETHDVTDEADDELDQQVIMIELADENDAHDNDTTDEWLYEYDDVEADEVIDDDEVEHEHNDKTNLTTRNILNDEIDYHLIYLESCVIIEHDDDDMFLVVHDEAQNDDADDDDVDMLIIQVLRCEHHEVIEVFIEHDDELENTVDINELLYLDTKQTEIVEYDVLHDEP